MGDFWIVERVGGRNRKRHTAFLPAKQDLSNRISSKQTPPYSIREAGTTEWVETGKLRATLGIIRDVVRYGDPGRAIVVRGGEDEPRFRIVHRWKDETRGGQVVEAALSQLGVEYKWAWADPTGDGNGEEGFDCSGLTSWCYAQVGVLLPHNAYQQSISGGITKFGAIDLALPGDLVFYNAGRRTPDPDHIGIYAGEGMVIDASSYWDAVVRRRVDANPIIGFGRSEVINGKL